jgi:hypothetical protein
MLLLDATTHCDTKEYCLKTRLCLAVLALQDKVQDLLSQQLDASDNEAVLQELQQLEDQALQEELKHMPAVPDTQPQQQAQQQPAAAVAAAGAEAAVLLEEELPSVPTTKVCVYVCDAGLWGEGMGA